MDGDRGNSSCPDHFLQNSTIPSELGKSKNMIKDKVKSLTEAEREAYALVGRHGGRATFRKRGKKHMSAIGKKGATKRWSKK
jgi:hypothetical protein